MPNDCHETPTPENDSISVVIARTAQTKAKLSLEIKLPIKDLPPYMRVEQDSTVGAQVEAKACWAQPRMAKTYRREGRLEKVASYNAGSTFYFTEQVFHDLRGLMDILVRLANHPQRQYAVIAGSLTEVVKANPLGRHRRRADTRKYGSQGVSIHDKPTRLLIMDFDCARLERWDPNDPEAGVIEVCQRLGAPFVHASVLAHITGSQQPQADSPARLRLYFLLKQPWTLKDQSALLKDLRHAHPSLKIDASTAKVGQLIYIGDPLILETVDAASLWNPAAVAVDDPIRERWHLYERQGDLVLEKPELQTVYVRWTATPSSERTVRSAQPRTIKIREHGCELDALDEYGDEVHTKILDASYNLARLHGGGPQTTAVVEQIASGLRMRAQKGGPLEHRLDRLSTGALEEEIERAYLGAWARQFGRRVDRLASDKLDAAGGTMALHEAISRFCNGQDRRSLIQASMGLGKTTVVIEQVLAAQARVDFYVPDLALAEELQRKIQSLGGEAIVIRGRTAPVSSEPDQLDDTSAPLNMCRKAQVIERLQEMGAAPLGGDQLCRRYLRGENRYELCEYFSDCAYIRQHTEVPLDTQFVIRAHDYLALERGWLDLEMERRIGRPNLHVVDEDPVVRLITHQEFPLDRLVQEYRDRRGWLAVIAQALSAGSNPVSTFIEHVTGSDSPSPDDDDAWSQAQEAIDDLIEECPDRGVSGVRPSMSTQELLNRLERGVRVEHCPVVLEAIRDAIMQRKNFTHAISVDRRDGILMVHVDRLRPAARVASRRTRLLLLDGSADRLALNQVFGPLSIHQIQVRRQARTLQVRDKLFSDTQIRADNWRQQDILGLIALHKTTDQPGVVTRKSLTSDFVRLGVPTLHHGNLRGKDILKLANPIVVVGRMQPPPLAVESQARALYPFDDLKLAGNYERQEAVYRVSSTQVQIIDQQSFTHSDPRVNARLAQARDCEQLQAIDRGRLIHCTTAKTVLVFTHQPISDELEVELVSVHDLLGPEGLMELLAKAHGRLPLNFHWLMEFDPARFPHEVRAKDFARRVVEWARATPLPVVRLVEDRQPGARGRAGHAVLWVGLDGNLEPNPEKEGCLISSI